MNERQFALCTQSVFEHIESLVSKNNLDVPDAILIATRAAAVMAATLAEQSNDYKIIDKFISLFKIMASHAYTPKSSH